jgi:beta-lactamase superfamily II metal-dependent hydrolase
MQIKFWKVGCGDAITINTTTSKGKIVNLFIDGGYLKTYRDTIKKEILAIQSQNQLIDRWIITHTDRDHIGGVEAFLRDPSIKNKENLVSEYWFNYSSLPFVEPGSAVSIEQGITLRDYLEKKGKLYGADILADGNAAAFHNFRVTILSPNATKLNDSKLAWQEEEYQRRVAAGQPDYSKTIEELRQEPFLEDVCPYNGGSIAILLEEGERSILLLGDAHPSVIMESLTNLGYSKTNKLKVDFIKLSHHGSKYNFSPAILELVECSNFIILGNGMAHNLPNKWTLSQILTSPDRSNETIRFYFNDDNPVLRRIFDVDSNTEGYNFECIFNSEPCLIIDLV